MPNGSKSSDEDQLFVGTVDKFISDVGGGDKNWIIPISANEQHSVPFKIDTGAQVNLIPMEHYSKMQDRPKLVKSKIQLSPFTTGYLVTQCNFVKYIGLSGGRG